MTTWNSYQEAIFDTVTNTTDNVVVVARAGTGKTTTIVEVANRLPADQRVAFVCFNKLIQQELSVRLPAGVDAKTFHSLGFGAARRAASPKPCHMDNDKGRKILKRIVTDRDDRAALGDIGKLVSLAKSCLVETRRELTGLAYRFGLYGTDECGPERMAYLAEQALAEARRDTTTVDFDDMCYLPATLQWSVGRYDVVIVDEAQDMAPVQLALVRAALGQHGRLIAVGDDRQAIYGWRGAASNVLGQLAEEYDAQRMPLPATYRCPRSVVALAQAIVPDYECAGTEEGLVRDGTADEAVPGDAILSRTNAPLVRWCLRLIAAGVPAEIRGREIGAGLLALIKKSKATTVEELLEWLDAHYAEMAPRLSEDEKALDKLADSLACVRTVALGGATVAGVTERLESLFGAGDSDRRVVLSSVHKAKGLEWKTIFVLVDTFRRGTSDEEDNLWYVAITRTKRALVYAQSE